MYVVSFPASLSTSDGSLWRCNCSFELFVCLFLFNEWPQMEMRRHNLGVIVSISHICWPDYYGFSQINPRFVLLIRSSVHTLALARPCTYLDIIMMCGDWLQPPIGWLRLTGTHYDPYTQFRNRRATESDTLVLGRSPRLVPGQSEGTTGMVFLFTRRCICRRHD